MPRAHETPPFQYCVMHVSDCSVQLAVRLEILEQLYVLYFTYKTSAVLGSNQQILDTQRYQLVTKYCINIHRQNRRATSVHL